MGAERIELVRAKWMLCTACTAFYVLVPLDYNDDILCYECIADGWRYDKPVN